MLLEPNPDISCAPSVANPAAPVQVAPKRGVATELTEKEIRWMYKENSKANWQPFQACDSLLIEVLWRKQSHFSIDPELWKEAEKLFTNGEAVVIEGLYSVNMAEKKVYPIYWEGDPLWIMRGTWFDCDHDWQPIDVDDAAEIESEHLKHFRNQRIPEGPVFFDKGKRPVLHQIKVPSGREITWNSVIDIYMEPPKAFLKNLFTSPRKLHRGFHTEASIFDRVPPVKHLIFVTHGIGQKGLKEGIICNTAGIREIGKKLMSKDPHFAHVKDERAMFLPVEWRSRLNLDGGVVDTITPQCVQTLRELLNSTAMDIMYYTSPLYRTEIVNGLSSRMNELYRKFLQHNPRFETSGGKISLIAHSLGSVISYDILTNWSPLELYDQFVNEQLAEGLRRGAMEESEKRALEEYQAARERAFAECGGLRRFLNSKQQKLEFPVENLFCIGSPVAIFLALRGFRAAEIIPKSVCRRIFNIFHPADPVAYRLEPLLSRDYLQVKPVKVHYHSTKNKEAYDEIAERLYDAESKKKKEKKSRKGKSSEIAEEATDGDTKKSTPTSSPERALGDAQEIPASSRGLFAAFTQRIGWSKAATVSAAEKKIEEEFEEVVASESANASESKVCDAKEIFDAPPEGSTRLKERLDFSLRTSVLENPYFAAIWSHVSYWNSADTIMFILMHLFPKPQESSAETES